MEQYLNQLHHRVPPHNKGCNVNILPKKNYLTKLPTEGFVQKIRTSGWKYSKQAGLFQRQELLWVGIAQSVQRLATSWTVKDRIPVEASFPTCVRTGSGDHPASYTIVTGSFSGLKRLGSGVEHPSTSKAEVKERVVYIYSPICAFMACSRVTFYLLFSAKNFWQRIERADVSV